MKLFTFRFFSLSDIIILDYEQENQCYICIIDLFKMHTNMHRQKLCKSAPSETWISYKKSALISTDQQIIGLFFFLCGSERTETHSGSSYLFGNRTFYYSNAFKYKELHIGYIKIWGSE